MAENVKIEIRYVFSDDEIRALGQQLADGIQRREAEDIRFEVEREDHNLNLKAIEKDVHRLKDCIRDGHEMRFVECTVERDLRGRIKKYRSAETGDIVKEEPFGPEDAQLRLVDAEG